MIRDDRQRNRPERDRRQDEVLDRVLERRPVAGDDRVENVEIRRMLDLARDADPPHAG